MAKDKKKGSEIVRQFENAFNSFWGDYFNRFKSHGNDYLSNIKPADLIAMKKMFSGINGIVTMATEMSFISLLEQKCIISNPQACEIKEHIRSTSPYANGYDIFSSKAQIVAEVKCNFPVGKNSFGAAQIDALLDDLRGLHDPTLKRKKQEGAMPERRFLVQLCEDNNNVKFMDAVEKLMIKAKGEGIHTEILNTPPAAWNNNVIYIVIIPLRNLNISQIN